MSTNLLSDKLKIYRVFQLIRLLNTPPPKPVKELVKALGTSRSDVYRLLKVLEELGYPVETDLKSRKFLQVGFDRKKKNILDPDELFYLQKVLQQHIDTDHLATSILQKFDRNLHLIPLADALPHLHQTRMTQLAQIGVEMGWCIRLIRYHSTSSSTVKDRLVEPLSITIDKKYLIAWEPVKNRQGQFKFSRLQDIELLDDQPVSNTHIASPMDLFGLTGEAWLNVHLELSPLAHHLLVEEFPQAQAYIQQSAKSRVFQGPVRNWKGVGRFVLGLPGEVKSIGPPKFLHYLEEKRGGEVFQ